MFYVSSQPTLNVYGITDTEDGVEEFYDRDVILNNFSKIKIKGVTPSGIKVVNAARVVAQKSFDKFGSIVKKKIYDYDYETCENLARSGGFVRKIKEYSGTPDEFHRITYEHIYPDSIKEVVKSASKYSNNLIEVDCSNIDSIKTALRNNVCLVLQHSTKGTLTAFICTGSMEIMDKIYEPGFFDGVFLTKSLTDLTYDVGKVYKGRDDNRKTKNPDLLNVFSCSLRFRAERTKTDKPLKELSSPFYSVNPPRVLGMFILDDPMTLGDLIIPEFKKSKNKGDYKFNFDLYNEVKTCIDDASNYFGNEDKMRSICNGTFREDVTIHDIIERFDNKFDYMEHLRFTGYSFN